MQKARPLGPGAVFLRIAGLSYQGVKPQETLQEGEAPAEPVLADCPGSAGEAVRVFSIDPTQSRKDLSQELVPKLCLGTHMFAKLCFAGGGVMAA